MEKVKFSIIIPAYNADQFLRASVDSILKQQYANYEIVLVDDGSSDSTGDICDEYARNESRITVLHQKNGGLSTARNSGIRIATGDYIGFLDADDFYAEDALNRIANCIEQNEKPDVFIGRLDSFSEDTEFNAKDYQFDAIQINGKTRDEVLSYLLSIPFMYTSCRYFVKRELMRQKQLEFIPGLRHEDEAWTPALLMTASSFCAEEKPFYVYRLHSSSIMTTVNPKKQMDKLWIASKFSDDQKELQADDIRYVLLESRIQQLTLSAVSESYLYSWTNLRIIGAKCAELYVKHPSAFAELPKLKNLALYVGWRNALCIMAYYIKFRQGNKKRTNEESKRQ